MPQIPQGSDIFGRIVSGAQVEGAVISTLNNWFDVYLQEMEVQLDRDRGAIPLPRSYTVNNNFESFPEDQLPLVVCVCPGLAERPKREGDGSYRAPWRVGVGVVVSASDYMATRGLGQLYAAAVRGIVIQHGSLGGFAAETTWEDERYDDEPIIDRERSIMATQSLFTVEVEQVVTRFAGPVDPPDPPDQPGSQWPIAEHVIIQIEKRKLTEGVA